MLIARWRPLVLFWRLAHNRVVSDHGRTFAHRDHFHVIRHNLDKIGITQLIHRFLPFRQLAIHPYQSKILAQRPLEKRTVILLLRLNQTLLTGNQSLLQRTKSLARRRTLCNAGHDTSQQKNSANKPTQLHEMSLPNESPPDHATQPLPEAHQYSACSFPPGKPSIPPAHGAEPRQRVAAARLHT